MDDLARRPGRRPALPRRLWRFAWRSTVALLALVVVLCAGAFAALSFEAPRAALITRVDSALAGLFRGRLRLQKLETIALSSLRASGSIEDPSGRTVVRFEHARVSASFPALVWDLITSGGVPAAITIDEVHIEHAEVWLRDDGHGVPTLAQAFDPKVPSAPSAEPTPTPRVTLRRIEIRHAWLHGALGGAPPIDADISHLLANLALERSQLLVTLERAALRARFEPYALDPLGEAKGRLEVPLDSRPLTLAARFRGQIAQTSLEARGVLTGNELSAEVTAPAVDQRTLARFSPDLALLGTLRVAASARGTTDDVHVGLVADGKPGHVTAQGRIRSTAELRVVATFEAERLDAAALVPSAPGSAIDARGSVAFTLADERMSGDFELTTVPGRVAGEQVPAITTFGTLRQHDTRISIDGDAAVAEEGAPIALAYRVELEGDRGSAEAELHAAFEEPPRLVRQSGVRTRGDIVAAGRVSWPGPRLSGSASAELTSLTRDTVQLGPTRVRASVDGTTTNPKLTADIRAESVRAFGHALSRVHVTLDGTPERSAVRVVTDRGQERLDVRSVLGWGSGAVGAESATVTYTDAEGSLLASALGAHVSAAGVQIDKVVFDGAGHASGSFAWKNGRLLLKADTERLDAARLARIAGIKSPIRAARVSLTAALEGPPHALKGTARGDIAGIAYARVSDGALAFELSLAEQKVSGVVNAELVPGSRVVVGLDDVALPDASDADAWAPLGRVRANGKVDLTCMSPLLAAIEALPIEDAEGSIQLDLAYARESATALPALDLRIRTHDLALIGRRADTVEIRSAGEAIAAAPTVYRGLDFGLDLRLDTAVRRVTAHLGVYDDDGELAQVDAEAGPWPTADMRALVAGIRTMPLEARAVVPERRIRTLPASIRPVSLRGNVSGELTFSGTLADPRVVLDARARRLGAASERIEGQRRARLSVLAHAEYERSGGKLELMGNRDSSRALAVAASWHGDLFLAAVDNEARKRLELELDATLDELDLETIPALKNRQIEGIVSGVASAKFGPNARVVNADISARPLRVGQATMDSVRVLVDLKPDKVACRVDVKGQSGSLEASLDSGMTWPATGFPKPSGDVNAKIAARQLRLATLWPLVSTSVNELDGRLDADLAAHVSGGRIELTGKGRVTGGVVQIPAIGQRLDAIDASVAVDRSTLVIRDLRARGVTGALSGNARIEVDEHLGLRRATASVSIAKSQKIPVTVEGVALGDASGKVDVEVLNRPERLAVVIRVPEFQLDVPDTGRSGVQDLARNERVRIGSRRSDAKFVALPVQPLEVSTERTTPLDVTIELGSGVRLRRGEQLTAEVSGKLHAVVTDRPDVTGELQIRQGSLDVSGKRFEIERGTVTFSGGDPSNPQVYALARWDSPTDHAVFASYVGSAKDGKLTLRAEPPLTQDEILNLLLFGTPEGSVSAGGGDSATSAVGVAGGTATQGINRAISDLTNLDIQARVDTSTGDARPELVVPLTRRLSARVTRAIGEPAPGASPDRTFLTLELRLKRHWALSALFGDRGASALDLVWRRHY
jgi:translocation and assembly module TamB